MHSLSWLIILGPTINSVRYFNNEVVQCTIEIQDWLTCRDVIRCEEHHVNGCDDRRFERRRHFELSTFLVKIHRKLKPFDLTGLQLRLEVNSALMSSPESAVSCPSLHLCLSYVCSVCVGCLCWICTCVSCFGRPAGCSHDWPRAFEASGLDAQNTVLRLRSQHCWRRIRECFHCQQNLGVNFSVLIFNEIFNFVLWFVNWVLNFSVEFYWCYVKRIFSIL